MYTVLDGNAIGTHESHRVVLRELLLERGARIGG
jgi:hypothetical protein